MRQLCSHGIHQVDIHRHEKSVDSKCDDQISEFLMMFRPVWVGDQDSCLYQLGRSSEKFVVFSLDSSQQEKLFFSRLRRLNQRTFCGILFLDPEGKYFCILDF